MNVIEIRERARKLGIHGMSKLRKGEIIRSIQTAEGNQNCFGAAWRFDCQQFDCCWRQDCLINNPG